MQTYQNRLKTSQAFTPDGKMGQQVISLNTFTGHVGDASDLVNTLRNSNSPLINKPMNDVAKAMGNDKIAPFQTALEAAKKEYLNFLNAGHVESKQDQELADKLVDANQSPAQIQATLKQMAKTVLIRANSINGSYKTVMHKDYTDMLNPDSIQVLNTLGFGAQASRFNGGAQPQPQTQQTQQQTAQMFAVNPQTKQRIVSNDGGKTWQPTQ
ncbi:MAG: hypothetical protein ACJ71W_21685 [Terriglobales bacterium]